MEKDVGTTIKTQNNILQKAYITTTTSLGSPMSSDTFYYFSGDADTTELMWGGGENILVLMHYRSPDRILLSGCLDCSLGSQNSYSFNGTR